MRFNPHSLIRLIRKSLAVFFIEGFPLARYQAAHKQIDARRGIGFHHCILRLKPTSSRGADSNRAIPQVHSNNSLSRCRVMIRSDNSHVAQQVHPRLSRTAGVPARVLSRNPLVWLNLVCLDAPLVAICWQWIFGNTLHLVVPLGHRLALFLTAWLIYLADRFGDSMSLR